MTVPFPLYSAAKIAATHPSPVNDEVNRVVRLGGGRSASHRSCETGRFWARGIARMGVFGLATAASCGPDSGARGASAWMSTVDTVGDTTIVRTTGGSVWPDTVRLVRRMSIGVFDGADEYMFGRVSSIAVTQRGEVYAMDTHVPALRKYDADGIHIYDLGREGEGPGEYKQPDGGLAVLSDGRVVLRDPGNARFNVYAADGAFLETWPLPSGGGFSTGRPLYRDRGDSLYSMVLLDRGVAVTDWRYGLARVTPTGEHTDTLVAPTWDFERSVVSGSREGSSSSQGVPFSADVEWTFSPLGYFVGSVTEDYRVQLLRDRPLWIERTYTAVPVLADEADERERRIIEQMKSNFGSWRWNGPSIPDTKPPIRDLYVGEDGRIWVRVSMPGVETMTAEEARTEEERTGDPQIRFEEPVAFDVFEPDGRYLGHVRAPDGFQSYPVPIFRGDTVWAALRDDLGVISIVRLEVEVGDGGEGTP